VGRFASTVQGWFQDEQTTVGPGTTTLFCLPYAGGSASAFRGWVEGLPAGIACVPVHLPGRETRLSEPAAIDITELARAIARRAGDRPFAIFGHSMGARLAFEATCQLRRDGMPLPVALFVSGCRPPHMDTPLSRISRLPDDELCARLLNMGGTPPGVLDHPELRALLLPVLRADFAMVEAYRYRPEPPLPVPIVAFAGAGDAEADTCDMTGWSAHSTGSTRLHTLPGDHFFLHSYRARLLGLITAELAGLADNEPMSPGDLDDDEILVVEARLDELPELCDARDELSASEARRAASMRRPLDAARFVGRSVLLRRLLRRAGVEIGTAELPRGPGGKPAVAHRSGLRFNATHSDGIALIAFSPGREIGVDVERLSPVADLDAFVSGGLDAAEREALAFTPDGEVLDDVLRIWTAKESVRKATGDGLAVEPTEFGFAGQTRRPWRAEVRPGYQRLAAWRVYHLDLDGAVGALALGGGDWRLRYQTIRGGR
jgi:surfactin synthase thioesterase subunit/phosphopantetheinyl transferase